MSHLRMLAMMIAMAACSFAVSKEKQMFKDYDDALSHAIRAFDNNQLEEIRRAFDAYPALAQHHDVMGSTTWVIAAVTDGQRELLEFFISRGCNVNATEGNGGTSAITQAIHKHPELLPLLFKHGADPNLPKTRTLLSAINAGENRLELVKLLVENGADVNLVFDLYGDPDSLFTAVQFAEPYPEIVAYLKSKGAKTVPQLRAEGKLVTPENEPEMDEPPSRPGHVIEWFEKNIGPLGKESLTEIIPTSGVPLTIHVVPATTKRPYITLFTAGMSEEPLDVTAENKEYEYAELFIQLPKD